MVGGGRLADRVRPRRLCWTAVGLMALGFAVAFLFPTPLTFVLFYSWLGLGVAGGLAMAGGVAAGAYVLPRRVGLLGGAATASYAAAGLFALPLVAQLSAAIGWLAAVRAAAIVSLAVAAVFLLFMPPVPPPRQHHLERATLLQVFTRPRLWTGFVIQALASSLGAFAIVNVAVYARLHGLGLGIATLALTGVAAGNVVGRMTAGAGADRVGADRVLLLILVLNLVATALFAAGTAGVAAILLAAIAAGCGFGGAAGVMPRAGAVSAPDAPNTAFGILFAGYAFGAFASPLAGAAAGGGTVAWIVVGAPSLVGLAVLVLREPANARALDPDPG
jgi:predicted MFS family arabinose efflux permease